MRLAVGTGRRREVGEGTGHHGVRTRALLTFLQSCQLIPGSLSSCPVHHPRHGEPPTSCEPGWTKPLETAYGYTCPCRRRREGMMAVAWLGGSQVQRGTPGCRKAHPKCGSVRRPSLSGTADQCSVRSAGREDGLPGKAGGCDARLPSAATSPHAPVPPTFPGLSSS